LLTKIVFEAEPGWGEELFQKRRGVWYEQRLAEKRALKKQENPALHRVHDKAGTLDRNARRATGAAAGSAQRRVGGGGTDDVFDVSVLADEQ
jgi:hypothetical protein